MKKQTSLILVCGLPGTGKSTVAKEISKKTKAFLFNTDIIRKEFFPRPAYSQKEKYLVYEMLFEMVDYYLGRSKKVVLDGTFYKEELRKRVKKIAEKNQSKFAIVEVVCSEKIARCRLNERAKTKCISDADFCVYQKIREQFEPIREKHFIIDSAKGIEKQIERFLRNMIR